MTMLIGSGMLLTAMVVGAVVLFRRRTPSAVVRSVVAAAVIYLTVAFLLELGATLIERNS